MQGTRCKSTHTLHEAQIDATTQASTALVGCQHVRQAQATFFDHYNTCQGDEKWFFLMWDGKVCRVFPEYTVTDEGVVEVRVSMPSDPSDTKIYHNTRIPKVMFLAVTARPRPEYGFDGKVCLWPFAVTTVARRSDRRTGPVAGVTQMLQTVNVDAAEYRMVM